MRWACWAERGNHWKLKWRRRPAYLARLSCLQLELLGAAAALLRPGGAGIALAYLMLTGPSLAASEAFDLAFRIVVAIVLVANVIEAVQQVYRLWRSRARAGAAAARQSVH